MGLVGGKEKVVLTKYLNTYLHTEVVWCSTQKVTWTSDK